MDRNQKKKYKTWDEAFRGLIPAVRQQSVRTAEYTQAMFHVACSSETLQQIEEAAPYLKEEYEDVDVPPWAIKIILEEGQDF